MRLLRPGASHPRLAAVHRPGADRVDCSRVPEFPSHVGRASSTLDGMSDTTPPPQVWPTLRANDARGLIRFLVDVVGFEETVVYGDGDVVHHAQLSWPLGGGVMLGSVRNDPDDRWSIQSGTVSCYVVVDDPDALFARVRAGGAEIIDELHNTDYGSRDFAIRDP